MPATASQQWLKHTRTIPCPICGKGSRCQFTENGAYRCFRVFEAPVGWKRVRKCKDGTGIFRPKGETKPSGAALPRSRKRTPKRNSAVIDWAEENQRFIAALTPDNLQRLAVNLGVSAASLQAIDCGWGTQHDLRELDAWGEGWGVDYPDGAWSFPERDAERKLIGLSFRALDGRKGSPKGAKRGLIIPSIYSADLNPVPVVEGPSDVAAFITMGIPAIGRPNNCGGGELLAALLVDHQAMVVGENDERLIVGGTTLWPGRDGAHSVARALACRWKRPVCISLPPKPHKDIRAWFNARETNILDAAVCAALGRELLEALQASSEEVQPTPPELRIRIERSHGSARANIFAAVDGRTICVDEFKPTSEKKRKAFAQVLIEKEPALKTEDVEAKLLMLVAEPQRTKGDDTKPRSPESLLAEYDEQTLALLEAMPANEIQNAETLLMDPGLINRILTDINAMGIVGERALAMTIYFLGVSRLLEDPLAAIVQGLSSSGKSFVVQRVAQMFPDEALLTCTTMTPQALYYMKQGRLIHRWVVAGERSRAESDDTAEATRALREMISSKKLIKAVTIKNGGRMETVMIEQDGPIAYVESTTLTTIFDEDANRCLLLATDESSDQTKAILMASAAAAEAAAPDVTPVVLRHHALQRLLKRVQVVIPYATALGSRVPIDRPEARRAFPHALQMIKAVALLHQRQRVSRPLEHGDSIVATVDDYKVARRLLISPMSRAIGGALTTAATRLGKRLQERYSSIVFNTTQAVREDKVINSRGKMNEYLTTLQNAGWVELEEQGRGNKPSEWRMVADPPEIGSDWLPEGDGLEVRA